MALAHEMVGHTGQGLWHHKGMQLPAYIQHIANDLMQQRGMGESQAVQMAIGVCERWARGGSGVTPETRAKAAAAIAEWNALKAKSKVSRSAMDTMTSPADADGLDASWDGDHSDLPDLTGLDVADFAAADGGDSGTVARAMPATGTGARFAKLKSSLAAKGASNPGALAAYIGRKKYGKARFVKLASAARKGKGGVRRAEVFRAYPLEDYHIVRTGEGDSSGRVIEAYATVFDTPTEIHDHQGDYEEEIDRAAFNKRIADLERSRSGFAAAKVFYNHGMTIHGSPSDRYSMPVAVCEGVRAENRGPVTRSRYLDTPLGNEVLEMWRSGAITAQSFTGAIIRSSPQLRRGEKYRPSNGQLIRVRRLELGLREYGPTPFPAYTGAELVGVRMSPLGTFAAEDEDEDPYNEALPLDEEAAPGEPLVTDEHSARYHQHALYAMRSREMREAKGLTW